MKQIMAGGTIDEALSSAAPAEANHPLLVVAVDPGASSAFIAIKLTGLSNLHWVAFGRVHLHFSAGESARELFEKEWTPEWHNCGDINSLQTLLQEHEGPLLLAVEQQRGYLREHLFDPIISLCSERGFATKVVQPSEKFHSLGVSRDKQAAIAAASGHAVSCPPLQALLNSRADGAHDFANAFLIAIMVLQEIRSLHVRCSSAPYKSKPLMSALSLLSEVSLLFPRPCSSPLAARWH